MSQFQIMVSSEMGMSTCYILQLDWFYSKDHHIMKVDVLADQNQSSFEMVG